MHEPIIGLPDFKIVSYQGTKTIEITAEYTGKRQCPQGFTCDSGIGFQCRRANQAAEVSWIFLFVRLSLV